MRYVGGVGRGWYRYRCALWEVGGGRKMCGRRMYVLAILTSCVVCTTTTKTLTSPQTPGVSTRGCSTSREMSGTTAVTSPAPARTVPSDSSSADPSKSRERPDMYPVLHPR